MKQKLISLITALSLILSLVPAFTITVGAESAADLWSGSGTEGDPYIITSLDDLEAFRDYVNNGGGENEYFKLADEIDEIDMSVTYHAADEDNSIEEKSWEPIGNEGNPFKGTFDGNGKTIKGLYINSTNNCQGLFGYVGSNGTVKNLTITDSSVKGYSSVGGVIGYNAGKVENLTVTDSSVTGGSTGGVVGSNFGTVSNSCNTGKVSDGNNIGGVVGHNFGTVSNSYNTGTVEGSGNVGGVVGSHSYGTVSNSYNTGTVTGYSEVGGVVGYDWGTVSNCYYNSEVYTKEDTTTGVTGKTTAEFNSGEVAYLLQAAQTDKDEDGNIIQVWGQSLPYTAADEESGTPSSGDPFPVLTSDSSKAVINLATIDPEYAKEYGEYGNITNLFEGSGTEGDPYIIPDLKTLEVFRNYVNSGYGENEYFKLADEIDEIDMSVTYHAADEDNSIEEKSWEPIGNSSTPFKGTFDGNGKTIKGLYINSTKDYKGLFSYVGSNGTVKNLTVTDSSVTGGWYVGGAVGYNEGGTVEKLIVTDSSVTGEWYVGGVAGYNDSGTVLNCYNTGTVKGSERYVGGVVGCNNNGSTVSNSYNTGTVKGALYTGGVVGCNNDGDTVSNSYNMGAVTGGDNTGGVVGINNTDCMVSNSYNTGAVTGGLYTGGVVGFNYTDNTVSNSYNTGAVTGSNGTGGVVGYNMSTVSNSYSTGTVEGGNYIGSVVGYNNGGEVSNSYYNSEVYTKEDTTSGVTGKTTAEFNIGEVAYLLQDAQTDTDDEDNIIRVWGQSLPYTAADEEGETQSSGDALPVLTSDSDKAVYKVTFMTADKENEDEYTEFDARYINSGSTVTLPSAPADTDIYELSWYTSYTEFTDANKFTSETVVTGDITVYAAGQEKYGGESDEITVEAMRGFGKTVDLSEYMSYAGGTSAAGKFTYTIESGNNELGANISGDTLSISKNAPVGEYTLTVKAKENSPQIMLMSIGGYGTSDVTLTIKVNIKEPFEGGGTEDNPYIIPDLETLEIFRDYVNSGYGENEYFKLADEIDMSVTYHAADEDNSIEEKSWEPIGNEGNPFKGTFDGNGKTIKGLYINSSNDAQGLFGWVASKGTVKNLTITDSSVTGSWYVGGAVGYNEGGTVENLTVTDSSVTGKWYVGGVVGYNDSGTVSNSYNTGTVEGSGNVGGVVGFNEGTVSNSYNTGAVTGGLYTGGVVGYNDNGTVSNSCNTGSVTGSGRVGGVVGDNDSGTVSNCYYNSDVYTDTGTVSTSGVTGKTTAEFNSGEVAWLLQDAQTDTDDEDNIIRVWGQSLPYTAADEEGETQSRGDALPVLTSDSSKAVYKVTFMAAADTEYAVKYANSSGLTDFPDDPEPNDTETTAFYKWSQTNDINGETFDESTVITEDITVYALSRELYGASEGVMEIITTYGEEKKQDLSEYTVYAKGTETEGRFKYEIISAVTSGEADVMSDSYFSITDDDGNNDTLLVGNTTPAGTYKVVVRATEKAPLPGLMVFALNNNNDDDDALMLEITVIVNKADGSASVTMKDYYCGEAGEVSPEPLSETNGTDNVTYSYKAKDADDDTYTKTQPNTAGSYTVRAVFAETDNYNAVEATADFTVNHNWSDWTIIIEPTTEAMGVAMRTCKSDSTHTEMVFVPSLGDTDVWTPGESTDPTEYEDGAQTYTSDYGTVTVVIPALGHEHDWGDWTIILAPTAEATGYAIRTCESDSTHTETVTLPSLDDESVWAKGEYTAPTEYGDGAQTYTSEYGTVTAVIPALGHTHNWGDWTIIVAPTEATAGMAMRTCESDSTHTESVTLPSLSDTSVWTKGDYTEPKEYEDGAQEYNSIYGTVTVVIPALGHEHDWGDWTIILAPTEDTMGIAEHVCESDSSHTETVTLPSLDDESVWTKGEYTAPTEYGDGAQAYISEYGTVTVVIPALGHTHDWGDWVIILAPTADTMGIAEHVCKNDSSHTEMVTLPSLSDTSVWTEGTRTEPTEYEDGAQTYISEYGTVTVTIPALGHTHTWSNWTIIVVPTAETMGVAMRVCKSDSTHTDMSILPQLTDASVWTEGTYTAPTEDKDGAQEYTSVYGTVTVVIPATGHTHDWGEWVIILDPTTETTGVAMRTCESDSTHTEMAFIPSLSDTIWEKGEYTAPTEDKDGAQVYKSDYGTVTVVIPATGHEHDWGNWTIILAPTAEATGYAIRTCESDSTHTETVTLPSLSDTNVWTKGDYTAPTESNDGAQTYTSEYGTVTVVIPALGHEHDWGEWTIIVAPTAEATGYAIRTCESDSTHTETVALPSLSDTSVWTKGDYTEPTESNDGAQTYTSEYGTVTVTIPATGHEHDWGDWTIIVAPTEATVGMAMRTCESDSTHTETVTLPSLSDTSVWTKGEYTAPTEDKDGAQEYTSEYGTVTVVIPALGHEHDWGEWTIIVASTEETTGVAMRTCESDSTHTETVTLPSLSDTIWEKGEYTAPTEDKDGSQEYISEYGTVTVTIPALGHTHTWSNWTIIVVPTAETMGVAMRVCKSDSTHTDMSILPQLTDASVWTEGTYTAPTESNDGAQTYTSEYGTVTVTIPATGHEHDWGEWTIIVAPTEETTGVAIRTCESDSTHTETVTLPSLNDTSVWTEGDYTAPTEDEDGAQEYTSEYGTVTVVIPALDHEHDWGEWTIIVAPTEETTGVAIRTCESDSAHTDTVTLPSLSDTSMWTEGDYTAPTEDEDGVQEYNSEYGTVTVVIPALDHEHDWGDWTIIVAPTAEATGYAIRTCESDSTHTDTVTLPSLSDRDVWTEGDYTEPTESNDGAQTYTSEYGTVTVVIPATGHTHDWGAWTIIVAPTEATVGMAMRTCESDSTHTDTVTLPNLTDTSIWAKGDYTAPTEDEDGSQEYISEYGTVTVVIPALGHEHDWGDWTIILAPTEDTMGIAEHVCESDSSHTETVTLPSLSDRDVWTEGDYTAPTEDKDGTQEYTSEYGTVTVVIPALDHEHDWGDWTIIVAPTEETTGVAIRTCESDSTHTETVTLPSLSDTSVWTEGDYTAPTEDKDGTQEYISEYGTVTVVIPALGHEHDWGEWVITVDPTLTTKGMAERVCESDSTHTEMAFIPSLSDTIWEKGEYTAPTEDKDGAQEYKSDYGTVTVVIPALGHEHDWGEWTIIVAPTEETTGVAMRTCDSDSTHTDTVTLPSLSDTSVWTEGDYTAPTEDEDGSQEYTSEYGTVIVVIPALGHEHDWGDWTIILAPTEETTGVAIRTCESDSAHTETVTLPSLSDTSVWTKGDYTAPTESNDGAQTYTSEYGTVTVTIPALDHEHNWGEWTIIVAPTEETMGVAIRTCESDSTHTETVTLPSLSDTSVWTEGDYTAPTEDEDGTQEYTSEYGTITVVIPALGHEHDWGEWVIVVEPTLTTEGTAERVCASDSTHAETITLPSLEDTNIWTEGDYIAPTEDEDGVQEYTSEYGTITVVIPATGADTYSIAVTKPTNGTLTYTVEGDETESGKAFEGAVITVTATPNSNYTVSKITYTYTDENGDDITTTVTKSNGAYTFEMPAYDITLEAVFTKISTSVGGGSGSSSSFNTGSIGGISAPASTATPEPTETDTPTETDEPLQTNVPDSNPFSDVTESDWFYEVVLQAYNDGLMLGVAETEFEPNTDITRGMFVTVLYRMEGEPETDYEYKFEDVPADEYFASAVAWASENKIIEGYSEEMFAPYQTITREQMAAIIYRYAEYKGYDMSADTDLSYSDSESISDYARDAVKWATRHGIMQGNADNTFAPQNYTTRAEAAAVFERSKAELK